MNKMLPTTYGYMAKNAAFRYDVIILLEEEEEADIEKKGKSTIDTEKIIWSKHENHVSLKMPRGSPRLFFTFLFSKSLVGYRMDSAKVAEIHVRKVPSKSWRFNFLCQSCFECMRTKGEKWLRSKSLSTSFV